MKNIFIQNKLFFNIIMVIFISLLVNGCTAEQQNALNSFNRALGEYNNYNREMVNAYGNAINGIR